MANSKKEVLTLDNLIKTGWHGEQRCVMSDNDEETMDHLFAGCAFLLAVCSGLGVEMSDQLKRNMSHVGEIWKVTRADKYT